MQVFKIIDAISVIAIGVWMLYVFNKSCKEKYNFHFFTKESFIAVAISFSLVLVGYDWYLASVSNNKNTMSGVALIILGANLGLVLIFRNSFQTSFRYALGGLSIQLIILGTLAFLISMILM